MEALLLPGLDPAWLAPAPDIVIAKRLPPKRWARFEQGVFSLVEEWYQQHPEDQRSKRRHSALPRARTINWEKTSKRVRDGIMASAAANRWVTDLRPTKRSQCLDPAFWEGLGLEKRPCPFVSCRYHLAIDIHAETGRIKEVFPVLQILRGREENLGLMKHTCSLDVADEQRKLEEESHLEQIGADLNVGVERVRQIIDSALGTLRAQRINEEIIEGMRAEGLYMPRKIVRK
jgi:hypothetical protein